MASFNLPNRIRVIDSHTAGEPTRCVIAGAPDLGRGSMADRLNILRRDYDHYRRAILLEPRGSDVLVGAMVLDPVSSEAAAGVIFFNNAGYLGMCGHGTIGLVATMAFMGQMTAGKHRIETPVGDVTITLHASGEVTIANVHSYRYRACVPIAVEGHGVLHGDIAWGGNWFCLIEDHGCELVLANVDDLTNFTWKVRQALIAQGITGADGQEIDHIELCSAAQAPSNNSRNFVLCPGKAYDRSPCGTGTSAKLACLAADGKLEPGQEWRQEGILGSVFTGSYQRSNGQIIPHITGSAYVTAEASLIFDSNDPFCTGIDGVGLNQ